MGRKTKITKECILETAFELLRSEGAAAVTIKRLASELECSTQPIAWQFGNMEGLRKELVKKTYEVVVQSILVEIGELPEEPHPIQVFTLIGHRCIDLLFDEPNLTEFLRFTNSGFTISEILKDQGHKQIKNALMKSMQLSEKDVSTLMQSMMIYTQGLCSVIISGLMDINHEKACCMLEECGAHLISSFGMPIDEVRRLMNSVSQNECF